MHGNAALDLRTERGNAHNVEVSTAVDWLLDLSPSRHPVRH
jgi:hypothetical protein